MHLLFHFSFYTHKFTWLVPRCAHHHLLFTSNKYFPPGNLARENDPLAPLTYSRALSRSHHLFLFVSSLLSVHRDRRLVALWKLNLNIWTFAHTQQTSGFFAYTRDLSNYATITHRIKENQNSVHTQLILIDSPRCYGFMNTRHWPALSSLCPPPVLLVHPFASCFPGNVFRMACIRFYDTDRREIVPAVGFLSFYWRRNGHSLDSVAEPSERVLSSKRSLFWSFLLYFSFLESIKVYLWFEIVFCRSINWNVFSRSYWDLIFVNIFFF